MRRILSLVIAMILMLSAISVNAAQIYYDDDWHTYEGNIFTLKVDGKTVNCEVPPIVFNDYSVVPARDVFETVGATVGWSAINQKVTVTYEDDVIELYINNKTAKKNGKKETMPIPPKLINGKTMIPARYVAESLGFDVSFDSSTDTIKIDTGKSVTTPAPTPTPVPTPSNPAAPSEKPTYDITLTAYSYQRDGDTVTTTFTFNKSVKFSHFMLKEPTRIVVDTQNTKFPTTLTASSTGYEDVTGIRLGQQVSGVRIVFDVTEELDYKVTTSGKKLIVKIGGDLTEETAPTTPEADKPDEPEVVEPVIPDPPSYAPTRTVYLDPGHGGEDPGAIFTDEDGTIWRESDINLGVALKVRDILQANGVKVIMSRDTDKTVDLVSRPKDANNKQATLFVSVHTNSFVADTAYGIETWGTLQYSATYAGVTDKTLATNIQNAVISKTGAHSRGVKDSTGLAVLKHSIMPSVLIEVGFISNTNERALMFTDSYRQKLAEGIAEGILKTLQQMGL
ncbi:MAG: N-acetylmuramoyl-L-alanine amidase [Clostridia bacterium]|nr:N-acetylmuramoyl-L-alanine amidase [Clostridia bacterium]